jgi:regulatory protein
MKMKIRDKSKPDLEKAYDTAIRLLARRPHSRRELTQKLRLRGCPDPILSEVLSRLIDRGYIDEAATCETYCQELIRKGFGPRVIRQRLAKRGFDAELIRGALTTNYLLEVVRENARAAAVRKKGQLENRRLKTTELRIRLARFLTQRGFEPDVIHEVMVDVIGS